MEAVSLSADSEAFKSKLRSYDTLNTMYHEARQEMELLNKQLYLKDNLIGELKSRLARYERIYVTAGDNEPLVLGQSESLLESLCKEICKHKQKKNELEVQVVRQTEEIQKLTAERKEKELELEKVRSEPEHEKDQQIEKLRSTLQERERTEATRAVLCTSLAEEADQLRGQLGATVKVCKELLARLEQDKTSEETHEEVGKQQTEAKEKTASTEISAQLQQLQEENQQLKQRVAYVQSLNTQWQKYDSSREDYIRGLLQRLKESAGPALVPAHGSGSGSAMLHQEISRLNSLLENKIGECVRLSREVEDVKRQNRETIQMLEQQVLIYTEDFKSERADRERAQGQIQDMKEQIRQLKQQLHKQRGAARENRDRDIVPLCRVHIGHQIAPRRTKDSENLVRSASDRQQQLPGAAARQSPPWTEYQEQSELRCPRCQARFNDSEAAQYFDHWEECAKL